jgi:tRNA threonylcarbamoyladenosine biosynthesis protein TsaE
MGRNRIDIILEGTEATHAFAAQFSQKLPIRSLIALSGGLGSGKTTFMQGLIQGLGGLQAMVQSPTFVYLHHYPTTPPVFHFDLYRLRSIDDFFAMGFEEYFEKEGITAIEWPERITPILPSEAIHIQLSFISETARRLVIS